MEKLLNGSQNQSNVERSVIGLHMNFKKQFGRLEKVENQ
jgi:hypothetical protein